MPWVPKREPGEEKEAEEEKQKNKSKGKEGKGGDKGGKKGKGKGDDDDWGKGGKKGWEGSKGKGKDFKGKGKEDDYKGKGGKKGNAFDDGKGKKGGKKGGKGFEPPPRYERDADAEAPERRARNEDVKRQATAVAGQHCTVRKHSSMGCAVVAMNLYQVRQAIVAAFTEKIDIGDHKVSIKAHTDKETKEDIPTDLFIGWGRQSEKSDPLSEQTLADFFDARHVEFTTTGKVTEGGETEEQKRARAQMTAAAQAQWAASGGAVRPPAPRPPGASPAMTAQQQAQQQQMMAAMQAQYMMRYQQQQAAWAAAMQAQQQQQQAAWTAHMQSQKETHRAERQKRAGDKAAFRVPTDEEVQERFKALSNRNKPAADAAAAPEAAAADAAPAEGETAAKTDA